MAMVDLYVYRVIATKKMTMWRADAIPPDPGEEVNIETVDENDLAIFNQKWRYSICGVLEINGLSYYFLELTNDAIQFNPANGTPRLDIGGIDFLTVTMAKKDIEGNYHTAVGDNDRVYISASGGEGGQEYIDLVAGVGTGKVYSAISKGVVSFTLAAVDIAPAIFTCESN